MGGWYENPGVLLCLQYSIDVGESSCSQGNPGVGGEEKKGAGNRILKKTGSGREIQYMHNINIIMHNIKFCEFFNL